MKVPFCYANLLNDCSGTISSEHIVTSSLIDKEMHVVDQDLNGKLINKYLKKDFTLKILCHGHNQRLSPVDNQFKYFLKYLLSDNEHTKLIKDNSERNIPPLQFNLKGNSMEKWCVKTLINYCYYTEYPITPKINFKYVVPRIFGRIPFPFPYGFWLMKKARLTSMEKPGFLQIQLYRDAEDDFITGGVLNFQGHLFLVWLPAKNSSSISNRNIKYDGQEFEFGNNLIWHPDLFSMPIKIKNKIYLTSHFKFKWVY